MAFSTFEALRRALKLVKLAKLAKLTLGASVCSTLEFAYVDCGFTFSIFHIFPFSFPFVAAALVRFVRALNMRHVF